MPDFSPYIFRIQRYSIHDGPGIRTTVFFQGCPLACAWCHNPESQAMPSAQGVDGAAAGNPSTEALVRAVMAEVEKDLIFYDDSGGGVTFSGGEPLCQPDLVLALARACREKEIPTCLDTSGAVPWETLDRVCASVDLILYDIKAVDPDLHRKLTGRSSGLILGNLEKLSRANRPVILRYPFIPGCTDSAESQAAVADFLIEKTPYRKIHILPFHHTAEGKYKALGMTDPMAGTAPPRPEAVQEAAQMFRARGFDARIGG